MCLFSCSSCLVSVASCRIALVCCVRYMAGVNLKILCKTHWSPLEDKFEAPQMTFEEKEELKTHIPSALGDPNTKLRTTVVRRSGWRDGGNVP